jgi:hypothetical protein
MPNLKRQLYEFENFESQSIISILSCGDAGSRDMVVSRRMRQILGRALKVARRPE